MVFDPRGFGSRRQAFGIDTVAFLVGKDAEKFVIHQDIVQRASTFFTSIIKEEWNENKEHSILLPADDPHQVELYFHWLYARKIFTKKSKEETINGNSELSLLVGAFVFGEKIQDRRYQEAVIDSLIMSTNEPGKAGLRNFPSEEAVMVAFAGTPEGSPLRKLLLDIYVCHGQVYWGLPENVEFLKLLSTELFKTRKTPHGTDPVNSTYSSCKYHFHATGEECYSTLSF